MLAKAVDRIEQLDRMPVSLASTLEASSEEPTMDTMRQVCMPVGKRAMAIGLENRWSVRQAPRKQAQSISLPSTPGSPGFGNRPWLSRARA
jgi:hypothetical protein